MTTGRRNQTNIQYNMFGMSNIAVSFANSQNEIAKCKLAKELERLEWEERLSKINTGKETNSLKNDFIKRMAVCHVYRAYSFDKYDPYSKLKDQTGLCDPNDSDDDSECIDPELPLPVIVKKRIERSLTNLPDTVNRFNDRLENRNSIERQSLPNINMIDLNTNNIDNASQLLTDKYSVEEDTYILPKLPTFALWKQKTEVQNAAEESKSHDQDRDRYRTKKETPKVKPEFKAMFPGNCRTPSSMRKFVDNEAKNVMQQKDSMLYKKRNTILKTLIKNAKVPDFITRSKTTSAIYRDYKSYKRGINNGDNNKKH